MSSNASRPLQPGHALATGAAALVLLAAGPGCEKESPIEPLPEPGPAWSQVADVRIPRGKAGALAWNDRVYLVGGSGGSGINAAVPGVEVFEPDSGDWILHEDLVLDTVLGTVFVPFGERLYAVSGQREAGGFSRGVQVFDPAEMTVRDLPVQFAESHKDGAGVAIPGAILIMGGQSSPGMTTDLVERFDPVSSDVEPETRLPYPVQDFDVAYHDGRVFVFGGQHGLTDQRIRTVCVYTLSTEEWHIESNALPDRWEHPRAVGVGGRIIVMSGKDDAGLLNGEFQTENLQWTALPSLPLPRSESAVVAVSGKVWVVSGFTGPQGQESLVATVFVYDPEAEG